MSLQPDLTPVPLTQPEREVGKLDPILTPAQFAANAELVNSISTLRRQVADYQRKLNEVTSHDASETKAADRWWVLSVQLQDKLTAMTAERDTLRAQLSALHPLADGYAGAMLDLAEARGEAAELNHAIEIAKANAL